jgi:uncharacterized protein YukE
MGGNPTTQYSPIDLEDTATRLQNMGNKVLDDLQALITAADNSCEQWFGSTAKDAYHQHRQEWVDGMNAMRDILNNQAVPAVRNSLDNYTHTENINKQLWMR